ncbi:MAG: cyclic beta 1-2 glucan synthetase [Bacteroidetes bacterium]|nr:cyclic beta 1-2 glucan synthetase [Bacteroidota bacterium]
MHKYDNEKAPLRSELFSLEQMEQYAKTLGKTHVLATEKIPEQLLKQLADNEEILLEVHNLLTESAKKNIRITPAGEWLLDNFYLIEEQIYTGKKHLPKGYSKGLPQLAKGPNAGLPRVYDLAVELISHSDGRVDLRSLSSFVMAYQEEENLKLGELWAIPIMLRLALIENLRRLAAQIANDRINKNLADYWADQMTETAEKDPKSLILVIADMARYGPPMVSSFVAELTRRLVGKGSAFALPLSWIEQRLSEKGLTSNELVHIENQKQAADQVSISNSISSLRFLSTNDWREFVEKVSVVERTLCQDTVYPAMDFRTRDNYRHIVEKIAKCGNSREPEVAAIAVRLAKENAEKNSGDYRTSHVGYYLMGKGLKELEKLTAVKLPRLESIGRFCRKIPLLIYVGLTVIISAVFSGVMVKRAYEDGLHNWWLFVALGFFAMIASSQLAISLINWVTTLLAKPYLLPRLDFSKGVHFQFRTLVVIPSLFKTVEELDDLVEGLEVRFLANRDANIHFALLTDFPDAKSETLPGEDALLATAKLKIEQLNQKYNSVNNGIFFMFHRPRKWNNNDKIWMGYERKRGKLGELNNLLRGKGKDNFSLIVGDEHAFSTTKYIITLDTDTQLPRDAAWKIVGTMAHPLNHPFYNEKKQRVTEGYGILQPRVAVSLPHGDSSLYARMHGHEPGIDPYTRAISDVYQDLFSEGSFIGKGIYDVDAFEQSLGNRFPENRILSHDLLEGSYARCGLLSDVQLYEEYPSRYDVDMNRRHRWIRGDWQIASWLLPFAPGPNKKLIKNPISALSRWKIFDNLRRSLVPISLLLLLLFGWAMSPSPSFWTNAIVTIIILPSVITFFWEIWQKPDDILFLQHTVLTLRFSSHQFIGHLLTLAALPYEALLNLDAIFRTNWRMLVSHKKLLQWNPSRSVLNAGSKSLVANYRAMLFAPFLAAIVFVYLTYYIPINLIVAVPVIILWSLSPAIAWKISLPFEVRPIDLNDVQKTFLFKLARKTWGFFENFVVQEENWLPPDNFQESPVARTAHRTSPTNIGLSLLANLSAYDFGYIPQGQLIERTHDTMLTMQRLERYRGHFYNWYDTLTLSPLHPKYISTVDSGNLAGHLLTLKQGLLSLPHEKIIAPRLFEGIRDTLLVILEKTGENESFKEIKETVESACQSQPIIPRTVKLYIDKLMVHSENLLNNFEQNGEVNTDLHWWLESLYNQCKNAHDDLINVAPWLLIEQVPEKFVGIKHVGFGIPSLLELSMIEIDVLPKITDWYEEDLTKEERQWLELFKKNIIESVRRAKERILFVQTLAQQCDDFSNIEFDFLFDKSQRLLAIGYNVEEHRRDSSYYDLLASEARLTTFLGIAQGKLSQDSWFSLGRQLTNPGTSPVLLSWSGSMFEYLMPLLVMPTYENTLLDQTNRAAVSKQIDYGKKRGVPWGISESGYNMVDTSLNYQYRAFGVPGLGLKRGLGEDLVIAPYATMMALMVAPEEACENLFELSEEGFEGKFGFFEAIDYTPARLPRGQTSVIVRSFMVHHQGMGLLALAYVLLGKPMQRRFQNETQFRAILLLLQERIPHATEFYSPSVHVADSSVAPADVQMRVINTPHTPVPEVQMLSNGRYHVMITNAGGGYSRWKDIAVTRWREDVTCDNWGTFCYVRDLDNDIVWSSGFQPTLQPAENYEVVFSQGRAEFRRRDQNLETHTEIVVSSEDDVEMRRVHIMNRSRKRRYIEVTSYAEVVLANPMADMSHPAFSNLFVQTEIVPQRHAILCTRRPRSQGEVTPWMFHLMKVHNADIRDISYETDRSQFIGRTNSIHQPQSLHTNALSGNQGSVLDPIVAIRYRIMIDPHESATVDMVFGMAETRDTCNGLVEKYQDRPLTDRAFELAWTHSQVVLRQINALEADAQLYSRLAGSVIYANAALRADQAIIIKNYRGQSGLWSYSVSGDLPIVLLQIQDSSNIEMVRQLVQAHAYWRLKGLFVDLVIWNEDYGGYRQALQNEILSLVSPGIISDVRDKPGGIFIRSADQISNEDRILFQTVARIVISDSQGTLEEQIGRRLIKVKNPIPYFTPYKFYGSITTTVKPPNDLLFFNGTGGFSKDGKEYVIITNSTQTTPAPWVNVIANPEFGTVISESGQSYTWLENAHEFRLTPWNNDAVNDFNGEVFYLRDEESGKFWSPAPLPNRTKSTYITRHGFGYSAFEYIEDGIHTEMTVFLDTEASIKFITIKIENNSNRARRLSATGYVEWVLGDLRSKSQMYVITELDLNSGAILARNPYNTEFTGRVAFFDVDETTKTFTTDRTEFIGRNNVLQNPEAMAKARLSNKLGAALDPCAAIQVAVDLADGESKEIVFRLGAGKDIADASTLARKFKGTVAAHEALKRVKLYWEETLGTIQIYTPDHAVNLIANGWLNYQTITSRLWGRSGFYQSGGAFGFRDQLQDTLSLLHSQPDIVRKQLLLCASRQFKEGDVQHWWHPPIGRGVRTTCSDDFLWLPFVTSRYVLHTGDIDVLREEANFLEGRPLNQGEESYYDLPIRSDQSATLYAHCVRAIEHGLRFGDHGIPLIGSGDWNDGMDKVGQHGRGESVWLGFFLYNILTHFTDVAKLMHDSVMVEKCKQEAIKLRSNIEKNCWDGDWYRRAYFDDGTPLGSAENPECKIDSIPQSWSVLSKAGDPKHSRIAMESAYKFLVRKNDSLIQLFDPAFDKSDLNPGYIKGYLPGVRENGGQYTHAAIWLVMAFAKLNDKQKTWELLKMINPINHGNTADKISTYKVEPYVIAADVYAVPSHMGRGGWTWYTGSAGWMYQLVIEYFLGIKRKGNTLQFEPCIPEEWSSLKIRYRYINTIYQIVYEHDSNNGEEMHVIVNGEKQMNATVDLVNDQAEHTVVVQLPFKKTEQSLVLVAKS